MKNAFIAILVGIAIIVAMLIAVELVLRNVYPLGGALFTSDPNVHYRHLPDSQKIFVHVPANGGHTVHVRINSEGFRGEEIEREAQGPRVMVYGDSFVMGEFSPDSNTLAGQLSERLGKQLGRRVDVINAGVVGYGPDQATVRMNDELPRYQPDVVVLGVFAGNDFGDLARNKIYTLDHDHKPVRTMARLDAELEESFRLDGVSRFALGRLVKRAWVSVPRRLRTYFSDSATRLPDQTAEQFFERILDINGREFELYQSDPTLVTNLFNDGYDADVALTPDAPSVKHKIALMGAVLHEAAATAERHRAKFVVVAIPAVPDVVEGWDGLTIDRQRWPHYDPANATNAVCRGLQNSVPCLNLIDVFRAHASDGLYFGGGDDHWSDVGQALAAETIAPHIGELLTTDVE